MKILSVLALIVAVLGGVWYSQLYKKDQELSGEGPQKEVYKLVAGHDLPASSAQGVAMLRWAKLVDQKTGGQLQIEIHPNQQLGTDQEMFEMVRNGEIHIHLPPTSKLTSSLPLLQVLDIPFFYQSRDQLHRIIDGPIGKSIFGSLRGMGVETLAVFDSGFKQITSNVPLRGPADFKGLKIRVMKSKPLMAQFKSLGAQPIPIDFHLAKNALEDGVVTAQENPIGSIFNMKFYENQKYMLLSNHGFLAQALVMNSQKFNELSPSLRKILWETAQEVQGYQRQLLGEMETSQLDKIVAEGVEIIQLSDETKSKLRKILHKEIESSIGLLNPTLASQLRQNQSQGLSENYIGIGLDTDLVAASARSGKSVQRGAEIAIDEINKAGGVLGKKLKLVPMNNSGIAARGIKNIEKLAADPQVVAVMGGIHSPVALAELPIIHEKEIIYLDPWAAATNIVRNGRDPNFVFRVSVRDEFAGPFLVKYAGESGYQKLGLLLENTPWGRGNEKSVKAALVEKGQKPVGVEWFNWTEKSVENQLENLIKAGAEALILVSNAPEGVVAVRDMATRKVRVPIISHWGITGGTFWEDAKDYLTNVDLAFLQTYSFFRPNNQKGKDFISRYFKKHNISHVGEIFAPVGAAHAYDLVHLLALAMESAGTTDRKIVRAAMENIKIHEGLIKIYEPPFTQKRHDALTADDFSMARYNNRGHIIPISKGGVAAEVD